MAVYPLDPLLAVAKKLSPKIESPHLGHLSSDI